jgi:hypothetical protein
MQSGFGSGAPQPQMPEIQSSFVVHSPSTPTVPPQFPVAGSQFAPHPQVKHCSEPVKVVKVPIAQGTHAVPSLEYVPAAHATQAAPSDAYPGWHPSGGQPQTSGMLPAWQSQARQCSTEVEPTCSV